LTLSSHFLHRSPNTPTRLPLIDLGAIVSPQNGWRAVSYGDLTEGEQAHWNEYTNLRQISDWPGFDEAQDQRRSDSRTWLQDRREYIRALAEGEIEGEPPGWDTADRQERYDFLADSNLNSGAPKHEVRLPAPGTCTDTEKVYVEEREVYLAFGSTTDEQKARKQANVDWLVDRRKQLWHLMQDDPEGNTPNDRQARYDALCIATHYGSAYEDWDATHNKWGQPYNEDDGGGSSRDKAMNHLEKRSGYKESPDGSNFDDRSDGIKTAQRQTAGGGTWLDKTPGAESGVSTRLRLPESKASIPTSRPSRISRMPPGKVSLAFEGGQPIGAK
jgi:hypothetical protein